MKKTEAPRSGVMMYVSFVFSAAFIGYSIGSAPLFGYNDGAQNHAELKSLLRKSMILIGIFAVVMVIVGEVLALPLSKIFVSYDAELLELTVSGMRIYALSFLFMGYAIFGSGFFTSDVLCSLCQSATNLSSLPIPTLSPFIPLTHFPSHCLS